MIFGVFADIRYHICRQPLKIYTYDNSTHPLFNHPPSVHLRSDGERFDSTHRWALQLSVWLYMKDTIKCLSICHFITTATAPGTKEIVQAKMKIGLVTLYWMKILPLLLFQTCMTLTLLWNTNYNLKSFCLFNKSRWGPKQHLIPLTFIALTKKTNI